MFDIHVGSLNIGEVLLVAVTPLTLLIQLLLCFKVKSLTVRLAPAAILALLLADFLVQMFLAGGMGGIAYLIFSLWVLVLLAVCGIAWAVWGISRLIRYLKSK